MKLNKMTQNRFLGGAVCAGTLLLMASSAPAQNLFVSDYSAGNVYEYTPGGVQSTFASGLDHPLGMAFDAAGNLFVANTAQNSGDQGSITEISRAGQQSTFASGLDPIALAFNNTGNLFVADYNSGNIYKYTGGVQSLFASGFFIPLGLACDSSGNLFVGWGGSGASTITKITPGGVQSTFATGLSLPIGLTFDGGGNLVESDNGSGHIYQFTPGGVQSTFDTVPVGYNGLEFDSAGNLFAATGFGGSIVEYAHSGGQSTFASGMIDPADIAFQPVPEPTTVALLGIGAAAIMIRRRK
jgi:sugar lactone lactonase YvrE